MKKKYTISVREELLEEVREIAKLDKRTISATIEIALERYTNELIAKAEELKKEAENY